jgi:hypothetical protein
MEHNGFNLNADCSRGKFDLGEEWFCEWSCWVGQNGHPTCGWKQLSDEFDDLSCKNGPQTRYSRDVAARPGEIGDETSFDWITSYQYDRNFFCCLHCRPSSQCLPCNNDIDLESDQLGGRCREKTRFPCRRSQLQSNVLTLDIANFLQSFPQYTQELLWIRSTEDEDAYSSNLSLLCAEGMRPRNRRRSAQDGDGRVGSRRGPGFE